MVDFRRPDGGNNFVDPFYQTNCGLAEQLRLGDSVVDLECF